ncbi:ROK family protein [Alistipes sp. D31t1_170403_E11]|uniref:ROK family protein n=1 Tax=Alistipes sp. D31t1_170403_E11 TaxID=2787128 RepID=UPI001898A504|nr:ROK family protein [Alistipes sp. D31t1_170403_E11]
MYSYDNRVVITLDAGGTNLVFGAMQANKFIVEPITLPSNASSLDKCLATMVEGFQQIIARLPEKPVAISFAFPGPADYPNGIIGGYLPNFPSFREGVALGPFLEAKFGIPVFINNDGDLFAYGEALGGALPEVNARLEALNSPKRYKNLVGYTFGTGLGVGIVVDNQLNRGDNSCVETFCLKHKKMPEIIVEDGASIRAVKRVYGELTGNPDHGLEPKDICEIADGTREGNAEAARKAFAEMGEIAGDAMATAVTLIDGLIVIGGGITAARKWIMPSLLKELRSKMHTLTGDELNRVQMKVYDLDDEAEFKEFATGAQRPLQVYGTDRYVTYDPQKRIGVTISKLGASQAISVGAYAFALSQLDAENA